MNSNHHHYIIDHNVMDTCSASLCMCGTWRVVGGLGVCRTCSVDEGTGLWGRLSRPSDGERAQGLLWIQGKEESSSRCSQVGLQLGSEGKAEVSSVITWARKFHWLIRTRTKASTSSATKLLWYVTFSELLILKGSFERVSTWTSTLIEETDAWDVSQSSVSGVFQSCGEGPFEFLFFLLISFFLVLFFNWSVVDLQRCVGFGCTAKWFSYT